MSKYLSFPRGNKRLADISRYIYLKGEKKNKKKIIYIRKLIKLVSIYKRHKERCLVIPEPLELVWDKNHTNYICRILKAKGYKEHQTS